MIEFVLHLPEDPDDRPGPGEAVSKVTLYWVNDTVLSAMQEAHATVLEVTRIATEHGTRLSIAFEPHSWARRRMPQDPRDQPWVRCTYVGCVEVVIDPETGAVTMLGPKDHRSGCTIDPVNVTLAEFAMLEAMVQRYFELVPHLEPS
jgi:hypothetical protein